MNCMTVAIIEDEKLAADNLELMIKQLEPTTIVLAKLESVKQATHWLSENSVDLLFVDIMLADGNSFQIFEQLKINSPVIFTTAYDQYAIKAFKLHSIGYLLKPINSNELADVLNRYKSVYTTHYIAPNWEQLIKSLKPSTEYQNRFMVHAGDKIKTIKTSEIAYIQAKEGAVYIVSNENRTYGINYTIEHFTNLLDPDKFFKINRQFIVNIDAIKSMSVVSKSRIKIELVPKPDEEAIVSVNNVQLFKEWLNK
jgi:two-component system, LytTR family, response regulator LytT